MSQVINLFVDTANQKLVASANSQLPYTMPTLFEDNEQPFTVTFLTPNYAVNNGNPYNVLNVSGQEFRMSLGARPLGTGGPTPAALQTVWTWVQGGTIPSSGYYSGTLLLNTAAVQALIGSASSVQAFFELNLVNADATLTTVLQITLTLNAVLDNENMTTPSPAASYFTASQCNAQFVKFNNVTNPGATIILYSPNGLHTRQLGIDNNGQPFDILT